MLKIALTCSTEPQNFYLRTRYSRVLLSCGAAAGRRDIMPVILPITDMPEVIQMYAREFDGFLFTGGDDVDPASYGEEKLPTCGDIEPERDAFELALLREVTALKKPVFGICRGIQIMNTFLGGTLYQDIDTQYAPLEGKQHCTRDEADGATHHPVKVEGFLRDLLQQEEIMTNSYHHQSIRALGRGLRPAGFSGEGLLEAMELEGYPYFRAVQWHPEVRPDDYSQAIFAQFLDAVARDAAHREK